MKITAFYDGAVEEGIILLRTILNIFVIIVATCVFAAAGFMFILRFFMIVFLMMTSPIAYVGSLLPITKSMSDYWWTNFKKNLIFAPVYMVMVYISLQLISFSSAGSMGAGVDPVSVLMSYTIGIISMVACLVVASMAGGNAAAANWGTNLARKAIGGSTIGLAARAGRLGLGGASAQLANSKFLKNAALMRGPLGSLARSAKSTAEKGSKASFDLRNTKAGAKLGLGEGSKGSYADTQKERDELTKQRIEAQKKKTELTSEERERANLGQAANASQAALEQAQKSEQESNENLNKLHTDLQAIEGSLASPTGISNALANEVNAQTQAIDKELKELNKVMQVNAAKATQAQNAGNVAEAQRLRDLNAQLAVKQTAATTKRADAVSRLDVTRRAAEEAKVKERMERERNELADRKKRQQDIVKLNEERRINAEKSHKQVDDRLTAAGQTRQSISLATVSDSRARQERERQYLDHLNSYPTSLLGRLDRASSNSGGAYNEAMQNGLRDFFKNQTDRDLDRLISRLSNANQSSQGGQGNQGRP
jgi:hypothetical protein